MIGFHFPVVDVQLFNPGHAGVFPTNGHFPKIPFVKHAFKTSFGHGSHYVESKPGLTEKSIAVIVEPPTQPFLLEPSALHSTKVTGEN